MYKVLIIIWLSAFIQCDAQKKIKKMMPIIDDKFEKFDIEEFKKNSVRGTVMSKGENLNIIDDKQSFGFIRQLYKDDAFCYNYLFYNNGFIMEKGISFNNGSAVGIWYYFDQTGRLAREEDTDAGYSFAPDDVIKYCEKHNISLPKGYRDSGFQTSVLKEELNTKKVWVISHQISGDQIERIVLDGNTGMEVCKEIVPFINN